MSKIKDIIKEERPIERFIKFEKNVSNEELLAILINNGTKNKSSKDLALEILNKIKKIENLKKINLEQLKQIKGIGTKKAVTILASVELARRINNKNLEYKQKITDPKILYDFYKGKFENCFQEHFYTIYLDNKKRIIKEKLLFVGTINYSIVHPREIFKEACMLSASSIICVHNHPSGDTTPSNEDIILTKNLKEVSNIIGIPLIDHVIIGNDYYSFCEKGEI